MWTFSIFLGTITWMVLFRILKFKHTSFPDSDLYMYDTEQKRGIMYQTPINKTIQEDGYETMNHTIEWSSTPHKGRRHFIGDLCNGLCRKDRQLALRLMREQLIFSEGALYDRLKRLNGYQPVIYSFDGVPSLLVRRLFAPTVWTRHRNSSPYTSMNISFSEWCHDVSNWYSQQKENTL